MELDVIGYVNKKNNKDYAIEIKSKLSASETKSTLENLKRFLIFFLSLSAWSMTPLIATYG